MQRITSRWSSVTKTERPSDCPDVATVTDSVQNIRAGGYLNGKRARQCHHLSPARRNIIDTVDRIRAAVADDQGIHSTGDRYHDRFGPNNHHSRVGG